jgi:hypothetical protein
MGPPNRERVAEIARSKAMGSKPLDQTIRSWRPGIFTLNEQPTDQNRGQVIHGNHQLQAWFRLHALRPALLGLIDPQLGYGIMVWLHLWLESI